MYTKIVSLIAASVFVLSGCTTNFPNPINDKAQINGSGQPTIRIVRQGSMPAQTAYRPYLLSPNATNASPKVMEEVIAAIVGAGAESASSAASDYYNTIRNVYRYRSDVFISGYSNFSDEAIRLILERGTAPQNDAQQ
jgi:hypothetical protein